MPGHRQVGKFWNIATNKETKETDIYIYGAITKWAWKELGEVSSQAFVKELNEVDGKDIDTINVNINSPGGSVFEAHAIVNSLKKFADKNNIKTVAIIDGVAASASSYLGISCDETVMCTGSMMMIHNPQGSSYGEAGTMRETADLLDKIKDGIIDIYMTKSSLSRDEISALMDKTTWMSPEEALENGFVDKIENFSNSGDINNFEDFDILNSYENTPEGIIDELKNRSNKAGQTNEAVTVTPTNKKQSGGSGMTREEFKNKYPELYNEIYNEGKKEGEAGGIKNERARLQKLDNLNTKNGGAEIVAKAKYEEVKNAEEVAMEILNSDEYKAGQELGERTEDFKNSGAGEVTQPTPTNGKDELDEDILNAASAGYGTV